MIDGLNAGFYLYAPQADSPSEWVPDLLDALPRSRELGAGWQVRRASDDEPMARVVTAQPQGPAC